MLQWPAAVRGGAVLPPNWLVTSLDLAATILDAAGLTPPGAPPQHPRRPPNPNPNLTPTPYPDPDPQPQP